MEEIFRRRCRSRRVPFVVPIEPGFRPGHPGRNPGSRTGTDGVTPMRFMIIRKADKDTEAGVMPSTELLAHMGQYMEEMTNAGILLGGEGLKPSAKGKRVVFADGKTHVIDGPFAEAKELIAGYCMINVKSIDEAVEWAKRWPCRDGEGKVELEI